MLRTFKERREQEEGFTLIELMVVVLIIAILLAIAIPTFLGAQDRARDRAAQSNLRNGITAAKTIATDADGFFKDSTGAVVDASDLRAVEGSLTWVDGKAGTDTGTVYVAEVATDGSNITLLSKSGSGTYFCMKATSSGEVKYGKGSAVGNVDSATDCTASKF